MPFFCKLWRGSLVVSQFVLIAGSMPAVQAVAADPRQMYEAAVGHMNSGEWEEAVRRLRTVVQAVPGNARLHNTLGIALSSAGNSDEAAEQFRRALELEPGYASALKNLALHEMARQDFDAAEAHFESLLEVEPNDPVAHLGLADIAFRRGDYAAALPRFDAGGNLLLQDPRLLISYARSLEEVGNLARAVQAIERMPASAPPEIHFQAALMLARLERFSAAARAFERAEGGADPYERGYNLVLAHLKSGQSERAAKVGEALVTDGHGKAELHNLLSQAYRESGDVKRAYDALREATEIEPGDPSHYIDLIALCLDHENFDLGLEIADISVERVPDSDRLHVQRGVALAMKGRFEDAQAAFGEASRLAPDRNLPGVALGLILMQRDRLPEAVAVLRARREQAGSDYLVHWFLAEALNRSGTEPGSADELEAIDALRRSVDLNPELFQSRLLLGKMLARRGEFEDAIRQLERARSIDPDDVSATYQLGLVYRRQGDTAKAATLFAEVGEQKAEDREQFTKGGLLRIVRADSQQSQ